MLEDPADAADGAPKDASAPSQLPPRPTFDAAIVASDASVDSAPPCVALSLDPAKGITPTVSGTAVLTATRLTLQAADQKPWGTGLFVFPPSTHLVGAYRVVFGSAATFSSFGDGAAMGLYGPAPGASRVVLLGLPTGPGLGLFFASKASLLDDSNMIAGDFIQERPTTVLMKLPTSLPFTLDVGFAFHRGVLTVDGITRSTVSAHTTIERLAFGGAAAASSTSPGFAITAFSAEACP